MAEAPIVSAGVAARAFILLAMLSHATQIADAKTTSTTTTSSTVLGYYKAGGAQHCNDADITDTVAGCKAAASQLKMSFSKSVTDETSRPAGCFWDKNGAAYFNTALHVRHFGVWSGTGGICKSTTVTTIKCSHLDPSTCTQADIDAEDALGTSISDGHWTCKTLTGWETAFCTDPTEQHYDWARNCPAHCAEAGKADLISSTTTTTATTNSYVSSENAGGQVFIVKSENSTVYNHSHTCRYNNVTNKKYDPRRNITARNSEYVLKEKKKKDRKDCGLSAFPDDIDPGVESLTFTVYAISETLTHLPAAALRGLTSLRHFEFMVTHLKTAEQGAFDDLLDLENFTGPFLNKGALPGYISSDAVTSACAAAELQGRALYDTDLCIFGESAAASSGEIAYIAMAAVISLSATAWIAQYLHRRKDGDMKRNEYLHVLLYGFRIFDLLMDYAVFAFTMQTRAFDRLREGDTLFQSGNSTCRMVKRYNTFNYGSDDDDRGDGSGYGSGEATGDDDDMYLRCGIAWSFWPAFSLTSALIGTLLFIPDTFVFSKKYGWAEHGLFNWSSPSPFASKCLLVTTILLETVPQILIGFKFLVQQLQTVAAVSLCFSMLSVIYEMAYFTKLVFKEHGSICRELSCFICWPFHCLFGMWGDETIGYALENVDVADAELGGEKCGETYCTYGRDLARCTAWTILSAYCAGQFCYCASTCGCTEEEKKKKCPGFLYETLSEQWCFCADGQIGPNGEGRFIEAHHGPPIGGMIATDSDMCTALGNCLCCDFLTNTSKAGSGQSCADLEKVNAALKASSEKEGGNSGKTVIDCCILCAQLQSPCPCSICCFAYATYAIRSKMKKAYGVRSYGWKDKCEGILCGLNPYCCGYTLQLQIDQMLGHLDQFPIENVDKNNEHFHRRWERPQGHTATPPKKLATERTTQIVSNEVFAAHLNEDTSDSFGFTVSKEPSGVGGRGARHC